MTWQELILADRHGLGTENIPAEQIKPTVPPAFQDRKKFMVLRYSGNLPMVGIRANDTFHILWIEAEFGMVYDHG